MLLLHTNIWYVAELMLSKWNDLDMLLLWQLQTMQKEKEYVEAELEDVYRMHNEQLELQQLQHYQVCTWECVLVYAGVCMNVFFLCMCVYICANTVC